MAGSAVSPVHGKRLIRILLLLSLILIPAMIAIYGMGEFSASERIIAKYCEEALIGEKLADAKRKAGGLGLISKEYEPLGSTALSVSVWSDGSLWSGASFCSLYHDGSRVTSVSYNPWYH